ncbi:MAG: flavodoxin family protein [Chitinophagales bacterium]
MKIMAFIGSPRKNGNTDILIEQILQGARTAGAEVKKVYINDLNFKGCQGCRYCKTHDKCRQEDDMTPLYDEIIQADAIILGSPIYMFNVTGQTKLFLDRWYALIRKDQSLRLPPGKKSILVFTQGNADENAFEYSFSLVSTLFRMSGMDTETLIAAGVNEAGEVRRNERLMKEADRLGRCLVKGREVIS